MYVPYDPEKMSLEVELYVWTLKNIRLELCVTIMCPNDELSWSRDATGLTQPFQSLYFLPYIYKTVLPTQLNIGST